MSPESQIDTLRFGIKTAKINDWNKINEDLLAYYKSEGYQLIISRIPAENIQLLNEMEDVGFRIKDIQLTYSFDLMNQPVLTNYLNSDVIIRDAVLQDLVELKKIARDSFTNYGHYSENKLLNPNSCVQVYEDWTEKSFYQLTSKSKYFVAILENKIVGFLTFHQGTDSSSSLGGIGAVCESVRGKNIFPTLVISGLEWGKKQGHFIQSHNVLAYNLKVINSFSKLGFKVSNSEITLHNWI